jgi:DNA polymerase III epsilon subunit-like protein
VTARLIAVDCETTGLDAGTEYAWEIAWVEVPLEPGYAIAEPEVIRLKPPPGAIERMSPRAAQVNRFHERTAAPSWKWDSSLALKKLHTDLAGAHLLGAMPHFDAGFLRTTFLLHGYTPPKWHYHLLDIESYAIGWLAAQGISSPLPWTSDALSRLCGIEPPSEDNRHTAIDDVYWAARWYLHMEGGGT